MQIGFNVPTTGPLIEPDSLVRIVTEGEALGFDYVTISDHIMVPRNLESKYPYTGSGEFPAGAAAAWLEQLATTAYIAALTKKLRFVLSVMVVPHRPAVLTAKVLSTIDYLSKGRLTLGIGVGWCREEFEAIGAAPFDDRGNVTDEWMAACRELWSAEAPKFDGKYARFDDVVFTPKPVQQPIPIWVGGESAPALRRTVRYAQGWYPVGTNAQHPMNTVSTFRQGLERFHGFCKQGGRDPKEITLAYRVRSEEHTSELQSHVNLVCRLLLEKKKITTHQSSRQLYLSPTARSPASQLLGVSWSAVVPGLSTRRPSELRRRRI